MGIRPEGNLIIESLICISQMGIKSIPRQTTCYHPQNSREKKKKNLTFHFAGCHSFCRFGEPQHNPGPDQQLLDCKEQGWIETRRKILQILCLLQVARLPRQPQCLQARARPLNRGQLLGSSTEENPKADVSIVCGRRPVG